MSRVKASHGASHKQARWLREVFDCPIKKHAYVWLIMFGDSYLPGIFVSMYSVRKQNPAADLVVMVTRDVSQRAIDILYLIADHIWIVPYITHDTTPMVGKQVAYYSRWINSSFTKWNALMLPYKKVVFVDGDTLCLEPIDELFDLPTPAAPWANPWMEPIGQIPNRYVGPLQDGFPPHGAIIKPDVFANVFRRGGMLFTASAVVLTPSRQDYYNYLTLLDEKKFGIVGCLSAADEQSLAWYYSQVKQVPFYNVHQRYNCLFWKKDYIRNTTPALLHYVTSEKPWKVPRGKYEDIILWYKVADEAIEKNKITPADLLL
jgi:alpha-N-acetylglucosamine transferase